MSGVRWSVQVLEYEVIWGIEYIVYGVEAI